MRNAMKRILKLGLTILGTVMFAVTIAAIAHPVSVNASSISIDGNYDDWQGASQTLSTSGYSTSVITSNDEIYFHISSTQQNYIPYGFNLTVGQNTYFVNLNAYTPPYGETKQYTISSADSNWQKKNSNVGSVEYSANEGPNYIWHSVELEGQISKTALGDTDGDQTVSISSSELSPQPIVAESNDFSTPFDTATTVPDDTTTTDSDDSSAAQQVLNGEDTPAKDKNLAENNNISGDMNISIDGAFSDWDSITKSTMTSDGDNDNDKQVAMVTDKKNVYFYVAMTPKLQGGYTDFQASGYKLKMGGHTYDISLNNHGSVYLNVGEQKVVPVDIWDAATNTDATVQDGGGVSRQNITQKNGDESDYAGTGYVWEVKIPFDKLDGITKTENQTITLENSNLWSGEVMTTSGSTGPVVLAGVGFAIAILAVVSVTGTRKIKLGRKNGDH